MAGRPTAAAPKGRKKRAYRMRSRASAAAATAERIREAATALFVELPYDQVGLAAIARRARVSLPTIIRKYGSKDALFTECARAVSEREQEVRAMEPGDVRGAARMLAQRYEQFLPFWKRYLDLEERFPAVARAINDARQGHLAWLAVVFDPFLAPHPAPVRTRQLAALFGATEWYVWWTWRTHLGLDAQQAEQILAEALEALVRDWKPE
jgi:AcrR family transcriptional regulator